MTHPNNFQQVAQRVPTRRVRRFTSVVCTLVLLLTGLTAEAKKEKKNPTEDLDALMSPEEVDFQVKSVKEEELEPEEKKPQRDRKSARAAKKKKSQKSAPAIQKPEVKPVGSEKADDLQPESREQEVMGVDCGLEPHGLYRFEDMMYDPPVPQRHTFENGLVAYLMEDRELPVFNAVVSFRAGLAADPDGSGFLSVLTGKTLRTGGIRDLAGFDFEAALSDLGAGIEVSVNREAFTATLTAPVDQADRALELLSGLLTKPAFSEEEFISVKEALNGRIASIAQSPTRKAKAVVYRRLFGTDSPFGRTPDLQAFQTIRLGDLVSFHEKHFTPDNAVVGICGDLSHDSMADLVRRHFGVMQGEGAANVSRPENQPAEPGVNRTKLGNMNNYLLVGYKVSSCNDPDLAAYRVLTQVLRLRGFARRPDPSLSGFAKAPARWIELNSILNLPAVMIIGGQTLGGDQAPEPEDLYHEIDEIASSGVPEDQLEAAKTLLLKREFLTVNSLFHLVVKGVRQEIRGCPSDGFLKNVRSVIALESADLSSVAAELLGQEPVVVVSGEGVMPDFSILKGN